jgi:hypothetical protein
MVLADCIIPSLTTICICGSIFILNNHCSKRRMMADDNQRKCVILTEEAYNSITQRQPILQEYPQYEVERNRNEEIIPMIVGHPPPKYNEIDK